MITGKEKLFLFLFPTKRKPLKKNVEGGKGKIRMFLCIKEFLDLRKQNANHLYDNQIHRCKRNCRTLQYIIKLLHSVL